MFQLAAAAAITLGTMLPATGSAAENMIGRQSQNEGIHEPTDCGNLLLWLDASDLDGDGTAKGLSEQGLSGNSILFWTDKATGQTLTPPAAINRPTYLPNALNGKAVVQFDGKKNYFPMRQLSTIRTVFWVLRENPSASYMRFLFGDRSTLHFCRSEQKHFWGTASPFVTGGSLRVTEVVKDGQNTYVPTSWSIISLITTGDVSANQITRDRTFDERSWHGEIAELIIYSKPLTDTERTNVYNYLKAKWGL
jgi:hypothetical protein